MSKKSDELEEFEMRETLDNLIKEYNKLALYTKQYNNPTLYDVFNKVLQIDFEALQKEKANIVMGGLFYFLMNIHHVKDEDYIEQGLRKLRVWSKESNCYIYMMYIAKNVLKQPEEEREMNELEPEELIDFVLSWLHLDSLDHIPDIPKKRPFKKLLEVQKKIPFDEGIHYSVEELCMSLYNKKADRHIDLIYQVLLHYPYAHTPMTVFLAYPDSQDRIDLLQAMIYAFEISHLEILEDPDTFDYNFEDNKQYILALESLGYIYKREGKTKKALLEYQKALQYDEDDHLHITEAMLMPLMSLGFIDEFIQLRNSLKEQSIYRLFLELYDKLIQHQPFHTEYIKAVKRSPLIMDMMCTEKDLHNDATNEEKRFIEDFIDVLTYQPKYLKELIKLHTSDS